MKLSSVLLFVLSVVACSVALAQMAEETGRSPFLIIQGGTLIDGTGASPTSNGRIVVRGNKILSVVGDTDEPLPDGARLVDARGKYILPGLIDGHAHYAGYAEPLYRSNGITSVVDVGNPTPWILSQKWAIERGLLPGPRIYATGSQIDNPPLTFGYGIAVETVEAARSAVRRQVEAGVDAIKVYKKIRPELLRAVIEEAHFYGIPVTGHIAMSAREALLMGIDSIEHAVGIHIPTMRNREKLKEFQEKRYTDVNYLAAHDTVTGSFYYMEPDLVPDLVKLFVEKGTSVTPTLASYWIGGHGFAERYAREDQDLLSSPAYAFVPEFDRRWIMQAHSYFARMKAGPKYRQAYKNLQSFLKQLAQAGGKIVAGTDSTVYEMHGINIHREMELLVDAGLTPMQALLGATRYAAEKVRKWNEVGSVESGKYADLLILDANPMEDIRNTRKIHMVIQNGVILDTELNPNFVNQLPRPARDPEKLEKLIFP